MKGLQGLLDFLSILNRKNIVFRIEQMRPDSVMVTLTLVGARVEVDFFVDHIEYSIFQGDESVQDDETKLTAFIDKYGA